MRSVIREAACALATSSKDMKHGKTEIKLAGCNSLLFYDSAPIAQYNHINGVLLVWDSGKQTQAVRERINGVLEVFGVNKRIINQPSEHDEHKKTNWVLNTFNENKEIVRAERWHGIYDTFA